MDEALASNNRPTVIIDRHEKVDLMEEGECFKIEGMPGVSLHGL